MHVQCIADRQGAMGAQEAASLVHLQMMIYG